MLINENMLVSKVENLEKIAFHLYLHKGDLNLEEYKYYKNIFNKLREVLGILHWYYVSPWLFKVIGKKEKLERVIYLFDNICDISAYNLGATFVRTLCT